MALTASPKLQRFRFAALLWPTLKAGTKSKSTQIDVMDCFTNELVERKSKKWEEKYSKLMKSEKEAEALNSTTTTTASNSFSNSFGIISKAVISDFDTLRSPELGLDIRGLSQPQLDNLLQSTLEIKNKIDFLYLVKQCIRFRLLPSQDVLVACLKYLSSLSKIQQIESFEEICKKQSHPLTKIYVDLAPFKAMAQWRSGGAIVALSTLEQGYETTTENGKRMIRAAFRTIAEETLTKKSEAVLVSLMEVARSIYDKHNDVFVVACVWKQCFLSEWFCDQKSAADLFEHYKELQQLVEKRSSTLSVSFLSRNNVDAVHRLIELFLQYKQREACSITLGVLFNYQYHRKDLRACAEIIKSCSELEMPLSEIQNEQFLSLFINQNDESATVRKPAQKSYKEFQYKF